jgi:S1-C subfamily serine protease
VGDSVYAIGNLRVAANDDGQDRQRDGDASAPNASRSRTIQTDAAINHGNSGALLDTLGV